MPSRDTPQDREAMIQDLVEFWFDLMDDNWEAFDAMVRQVLTDRYASLTPEQLHEIWKELPREEA